MLSVLCRQYRWSHDFWRRMGLREFRAWCDQLRWENSRQAQKNDSWAATEHDPGWQAMRERRKRLQGR